MSVTLHTASSESRSLMAMMSKDDAGREVLTYEYRNEPRSGAVSTMHAHRGLARLSLRREDGDILEGEYYTGRDRQHYGAIRLRRERRELST